MKRHNPSIRPQIRPLPQLIRALLIRRIRLFKQGHKPICILPALLNTPVPERVVPQTEDLPYPVFFDVLVLVNTALPPLTLAAGVFGGEGLMGASAHEGSAAVFGDVCAGLEVYDVLADEVVEKPAVNGTVSATDKVIGPSVDEKPTD